MTEANWWIWYADFSYTAAALAVNLFLQTTLIVAAGLVSARLLRRRGAAVRSVVLRMTLCAALLCPVASWSFDLGGVPGIGIRFPTLPRVELRTERPISTHSGHDAGSRFASDSSVYRRVDSPKPVLREADQARVVSNSALPVRNSRRSSSLRAMAEDRVGSLAAAPTEASAAGNSAVISYPSEVDALSMVYCGLTTIWFAIATALTARVGIAYLVLCTSHRRSRAVDPRLKAECESLARKLGVPMPRLLVSDRITNPCLIGWRRPTILLPSNADVITQDVLVHEMAHWARRDCLWNFVAVIAASVLFFQPLLWVLRRRLAHVADDVCDDYVIVYGGDRRSYARQLVDIAEAMQARWPTRTVGVGVMSFRSSLAHRVRRILDPLEGPSIRIGGRSLTLIVCLAVCGTLPVGMIGANGSEETREFAGSLELVGPGTARAVLDRADKGAASARPNHQLTLAEAGKPESPELDRGTIPAEQAGETPKTPEEWLSELLSDARPGKRGDPQLFAPIEVEAEGTLCSVAMKSRGGVTEKSIAMIAVKALVPCEKQAAAYESALAGAPSYSPNRDIPRYIFFLSERAEVPADPDVPLDWKLISNSGYGMILAERYAESAKEIADEAYIIPGMLTMPIPSIQSTSPIESLFLHSKVPRRQDWRESKPDEQQRQENNVGNHRGDDPSGARTKMVRFFDFVAKPGRSYRYRVAVFLEDPNRPSDPMAGPDKSILEASVVQRLGEIEAEDEKFFKKTGERRRTFDRQTAWSEPSNIVTVSQTPKSDPPIESLPPQMKESVQETRESVLTEWKRQYEHQQTVLRWPRALGDDFVAAVQPLRPIETKVDFPTPPRQRLQIDYRERYANYVDQFLPRLATFIGSRWAPQSNATEKKPVPGGRSQGNLDPQGKPEVIHWSPVDQKRLLEDHFDWSSQPDGVPTTLQLLYAQEDLWVLEAIVLIIRKPNGDARSNRDAVVKAIQRIRIGRNAVAHDRRIDQRDPAYYRYVDAKGEPLSGDQLRSAMRSPAGDPSLAVAKRLPVSMKLTMDQQRLNKLLIACGNSPLPLEVRRVRLDGAPLSDPLGEALNKEAADKATEDGNQGRKPQTNVPHSPDVTVELDGLIYIYNPVKKEKSAPRR